MRVLRRARMERKVVNTRMPTLLATSMHEAGHAIVQLATGPAPWIDRIEVGRPGPDLLGVVRTRTMWQPFMREVPAPADVREQWRRLAARDVVIHLAGPVAELRWGRHSRLAIQIVAGRMADSCLQDNHLDLDVDAARVRDRLGWLMPGEERAGFVRAWMATEDVVGAWWREIVRLGRELADRAGIEDVELLALWDDMSGARGDAATARAAERADWLAPTARRSPPTHGEAAQADTPSVTG